MPLSELKGRPAVRMKTPVRLHLSFSFRRSSGLSMLREVSPGCQPSRIDAFESSLGASFLSDQSKTVIMGCTDTLCPQNFAHYSRESRRVKTLRQAATTSS